MPVQVYHRLKTLMTITISPNWERKQKVLLLSVTTRLHKREAGVGSDECVTPHWVGPSAQEVGGTISDPALIHAY